MANVISWRPSTSFIQALTVLLVFGFALNVGSTAHGALKHQYLFNEGPSANASGRTIVDILSGANGTVIGPAVGGPNPTATAHALVLPGGASNVAPYVDLPNGVVSSLTNATFEAWYTMNTVTNWGRVFDFGSTTGGELFAPGGGGEGLDYFFYAPVRGTDQNVQRAGLRNNDPGTLGSEPGTPAAGEAIVDPGIPYTLGSQRHVAVVFNSTGGTGATPASMTLYLDGIQRGTANTAIQLRNLNDVNNWLGRSNWTGDANFAGSFAEFRIYDHAMNASEVLDSFNEGPVGPIPPTLEINRDTGSMVFRNEEAASQIVGYTITSAAGGLNPAGWLSIADNYDFNDGGEFDNDSIWSELSTPGSETDFSEFDFSTVGTPGGSLGDGGMLTSLQLGGGGATPAQRAWRRSIYEDVVIDVRLADGTDLPVTVRYIGNNGQPFQRSDLNFDGLINISDWNVFLANNATDMSSLTPAESYVLGDLNGDLASNRADFRLFKADFNTANGAGAFEALLAAVPEPVSLTILLAGCGLLLHTRTRRARPRAAIRRTGSQRLSVGLLLSGLAVLAVLNNQAHAALKHRYSFNEGAIGDATGRTIVDSISAANGTVLGAGSSATANQLVLPGGASATQAYVDLPNGIASSLTNATFEAWYTMNAPTTWARVFDFGSTTGGELSGPGGGGEGLDYIFFSPARDGNQNLQRSGMRNNDPAFLGSEAGTVAGAEAPIIDPALAYTTGTQRHVAVVYNSTGGSAPGMASMGLYINGQLVANPADTPIQLRNLNDVNNWIGRSNWTGDQNFNGSFDEFRIYDHALSADDVAKDAVLGPDEVFAGDLMSIEVDTASGQVRLVNNLSRPLSLDYYEITSAAGSLNPAGWTSIDGNTAPGAGWDKSGGADANELFEFYLPEGGFSVPANGELPIGAAFSPGGTQDLQFRFDVAEGISLRGSVDYITGPGLPGDYNGNGRVDAADYVAWRKNPSAFGGNPAGYNTWRANFGRTAGAAVGSNLAAAIPEPPFWANCASCFLGLSMWLAAKRKR